MEIKKRLARFASIALSIAFVAFLYRALVIGL